jgi:hypothetical protein
MRYVLAIIFLNALFAPANAAARGQNANSREGILRSSQPAVPNYVTPSGSRVYRDDSVPGGLRTNHDDPPAYNDPSKFGGG